ncbi:probable multidrug resistance-associated protein lethal(2)03659 [Copidosoma floridanum]|uniref:probable multidrug resistance-associated protein lethal(2)03659 n=1 Tax=Copidosoma floridanum TaxID=29053 RepID=UPI0006C9CD3F|nr:probable multidrug resistance-associated protein lethal(2)03659 [Copidosoma floridanum]
MDNSKSTSKPNPAERANPISRITWWWTLPIFKKGYSKVFGVDDLYDPIKTDESNVLGDQLEKRWMQEVQKAKKANRRPRLIKALFRTFLFENAMLALLHVLNQFVLNLGIPLLLGELLKYYKPKPLITYDAALMYAAGIVGAIATANVTMNYSLYGAFHVGGRIRISVCSLIYRKALKLSKTALGETAPGKIVNLLANDVNRFDIIMNFINYMWSAPLLTLCIGAILYNESGYAGVAGIVAIFLVVPMQSYLGKLSSRFRLQTAIKTDERVRLMDEIISGVQVIKMYAWEKPFCALVGQARKLELKVVRKSAYIRGIYMTFNIFTTRLALWCSLMVMLLLGDTLTAAKVFVFTSYFGMLSHTMTGMFVRGFAEISECSVVIKRLENFLMFDEFKSGNVANELLQPTKDASSKQPEEQQQQQQQQFSRIEEIEHYDNGVDGRRTHNMIIAANNQDNQLVLAVPNNDDTYDVQFDDVTAKWNEHSSDNTLENINVKIEPGKLYIVIGMVGSGKSSLLSTILGEVNVLRGNVRVKGTISYADQDAWVFGSSVRQNVTFGQEFDRQRYQRVVKACALLKDFKQFPHGDQTIVGERGSSLSGGQKARINLARAVYRQANIYLLDDPLSAVDAHVGKHLFEECLQKYLRGKTRLLATHQLQYVKAADSIILMDQGKLSEYRDYHALLREHPEYSWLIAEDKENTPVTEVPNEGVFLQRRFSRMSTRSDKSDMSNYDEVEDHEQQEVDKIEKTTRGVVKGSLLFNYLSIGANHFFVGVVIILFATTQLIASYNDYFIKDFVNAEESRAYWDKNASTGEFNKSSTILDKDRILPQHLYIVIYTIIVFAVFLVGITRSLTFYTISLRVSQRLHDFAFNALVRASMRFFDTNASGRILNRFSKDMSAIDELLPKAVMDASQILLLALGTLVVACIVNLYFLVPVAVIGFITYWIRKVYLKTSKNVKRLEGMTRSPVFTHLNATLNGLSTIRAYEAQTILKQEFDNLQDMHTSSWYMFIVAGTAFGFWLDMFFLSFTGIVIFSFFFFQNVFSGSDVGLAISQVMTMSTMIQWGMRQSSEVDNQLMAVERVFEYTQIPPEKNVRDKGVRTKQMIKKAKLEPVDTSIEVPKNWPSQGLIQFKQVFMRYSEEDAPVLKDLNITIYPTEKIGIVGRTGAGKSSLISALFRLAIVEGDIEIDGINTGVIAVEDLRKNISIIPQSPVLFSGTLRRNLDPFNEFSDPILWDVLEEVELKEAVQATGNGLDHKVLDRGSNYSVGQRQLICLSRAILRNSKVLMLDEATANVDPQTDALIQRTIRTKFAKCTVLTVAHRLNTIMDSDKVLVMDRGCAVEYDHPYVLLQNKNGEFTSLVQETGKAMYEQLCKVSRDAYMNRHEETQL